jgi:hypothetical protein
MAREKFLEGLAAFDAGKFEEARESFLQAYALKRHPAVLLNLGQSELKAGYVEDGGNHLQQFLREHDQATPEHKQAAREGISEARRRTGYAILIVDTDGALLGIDGQAVGTSPLADPVFVKPGDHEAEAKAGEKVARMKFTAKPGSASPVQLNLKTAIAAPPNPLPTPPAIPAKPDPEPWAHDTPPPGTGPYLSPGFGAPPQPPPQPDQPTSGRMPFGRWVSKRPGSWALLGLTGLGFVGTIGFGIAAANANSAAKEVETAILKETTSPSDPMGRLPAQYYTPAGCTPGSAGCSAIPCGNKDDPNSAHPYYKDACNQLRSNLKVYDVDIAMMATSIVVMVLSGGGTALYYYLDSKPKPGATPADRQVRPFATLVPIINRERQGLGLVGTF